MRKVIVSSNITIENPHYELIKVVEQELTIDNPRFYKLEQLGRNTYGVPKNYHAYKKIGGKLVIPFGSISNKKILKELRGYQYEILPKEKYRIYLKSRVEPFDYQQRAIDHFIGKGLRRGVLVGGTGSGKTNIGMYLIEKIGLRALWITHTSDLLRQSRDRAKEIFERVDVGYITAGKIEVGRDITFATVQTLNNVVEQVKDLFDVVIVDEAHHCIGSPTLITMFYKTMDTLNASYKFGLTATPKRADGLENMTFALLGNVAYEISKKDVGDRIVPIEYHTIDNYKEYDFNDFTDTSGMINPHKLTEMLSFDEHRNKLIYDKIEQIIKLGSNGVLVLAKRVAHCELIASELRNRGLNVGLVTGKIGSAKQRKEILECDQSQVLVATNSLAKEGLDLVRYDTLILTYSVTQKSEFTQASGRVRRKNGDIKKYAKVYEVCDVNIEYLRKRTITHSYWAKRI